MSLCATCGRPRTGRTRYCQVCGAQFGAARDAAEPVTKTAGSAARPGAQPGPDLTRWDTGWYRPEPAPDVLGELGPVLPGPEPPPARRSGTGVLIGVLVVVMLAVGGGAFAAVSALTGHKAAPQPSGQPTGTAQARPASSATAATSTPQASSPPAVPPTAGASAPATAVSEAPGVAANPDAAAVEALLSRYFTAINTLDYAAYSSLLDTQLRQLDSPAKFASGYATTQDSAQTLIRITDTGGGGLAATVSFTSHQNPADSINNSSCTAWTITLYLQPYGNGYLISAPPASYQPVHQNCP